MKQKTLLSGATIGILVFLLLSIVVAAMPAQQASLTTDQELQLTDIAIIGTDNRQNTQIALALATRQVLPSPTPITLTPSPFPTWTATPSGLPPTSTQETLTTPFTNTATFQSATNTRTPTRTPTPITSVTITPTSPLPDVNYTCRIVTTSALTRRLTPSPSAQSLGVVPSGTTLTIHPYDGSIPFNTTFWYVRVADSSGGGWLLYARIDPAAGTLEPRVTEGYMTPVDSLCIPALLR